VKRTTVMLPEATYAELEEFARRDGVPTAHLVREAMEQYVTTREERDSARPRTLPAFVGMLDIQDGVNAADIEEWLQQNWVPYIEQDRDDYVPPTDSPMIPDLTAFRARRR
jgi:hypothetical protein